MSDRLDPRFAAAVRGALLEEVGGAPALASPAPRRSPAPRGPRWRPVLAFGIAAVAVVAVVAGLTVTAQHRGAAPATVPFGGDCAEILTSEQASTLIGKPMTLRHAVSPLDGQEALAVPVVGGLGCSWSGDGAVADAAGLELTVLPVALRPKDERAAPGCFGSNDGAQHQYTCVVDVIAGGRWITGFLTGLTKADGGGSEAATRASLADLRTRLSALRTEPTTPSLDTAGWWSSISCARLGRQADLPSALGRPGLRTETGNGGMRSAGQGAAVDRAVVVNCIVEADTETEHPFVAELHAVAGAGPIVAARMAGAGVQRLDDVQGAEVYRVADTAAGTAAIWVVADGGALELLPGTADATKAVLPAIGPILTALDAHRRG